MIAKNVAVAIEILKFMAISECLFMAIIGLSSYIYKILVSQC